MNKRKLNDEYQTEVKRIKVEPIKHNTDVSNLDNLQLDAISDMIYEGGCIIQQYPYSADTFNERLSTN